MAGEGIKASDEKLIKYSRGVIVSSLQLLRDSAHLVPPLDGQPSQDLGKAGNELGALTRDDLNHRE